MPRQAALPVTRYRAPDLDGIKKLYDRGAWRKALYRAKQALRQMPDHAGLLALAGMAARKLGHWSEAEALLRRAVKADAPGGDPARRLAALLLERDRPEEAVAWFSERLRTAPEDASACNGMGMALLATGRFPQALTILSEAVRLAPDEADYMANLGRAFELAGMMAEARRAFGLACAIAPDNPGHHAARARLEQKNGATEAALESLRAAGERWPQDAEILNTRAVILSALGEVDAARDALRAAIRADPGNHAPLVNYATWFSVANAPEIPKALRRMAQDEGGDRSKRASVMFTLARTEEEAGDDAAAYEALLQANRMRRAGLRYDPENDARMFAALKREFADARAAEPAGDAAGPVPIFITGLPRSGTTLTETILSRHADVTALGELDTLMHAVRRNWLNPDLPVAEKPAALARDYMQALPPVAQAARHVTDKMPLNFRFIGHVVLSMPRARIVHVTRDARATCWSIFRHNFSSAGNAFAYDPEDLVRYHALYRDLMAFWEARFPGRIVTLDYDALVADQEAQTRAFLRALGLEWDPACLSPEKSRRAVLTASSGQVRRKVYGGSSQGWRRFERFAGEWLNQLDQAP
ncbi:tetratricopeptide repeat-containing sulfotransferase family protein [Marimonas lutisalis]|uniref:tetratricopeptide repeat-containing sulfotransferase family protein n=1 Tax=Marimonas lutisalis TaxID=2545756 RepID=UPI0010F672D2|nr:tetratricopeptide repeat-containing sulfotransferase family protein [Marimonas lutisalis]